jgi:hypothetical protein
VTRLRGLAAPAPLLLAVILVGGLFVRVWHNDYGLPFVWGIDEGTHFANRSVDMFRQGFDPGYYQNPAAYTYAVYGVLRAMYGPLGFHLRFGNVSEQFSQDPTQIWITARTLAAVLCMLGVAATYMAARRSWGPRHGLVAAALLSFAFLPVAYSRVAVTDVGSLLGVALALWGSVLAAARGRLRDYLLAGAGAGLGLAFKYTAGLALLPLGIAALSRLRVDRWRALLRAGAGVLLAAVVFAALNPYLFSHFGQFWSDLRGQAEVAANEPKPGQQSGGVAYYLGSLTWGLGWAGTIAAAAGAVLELRRNTLRGLVLVAMPVALFVYLSVQSRYFGRWLLPAYPAFAILGAVAVVRAAELLPAGRALRLAALAALTALVLAQPLAADVRTGLVLGREDTREQVRNFLAHRFPAELRVSVEPAVPGRWYRSTPEGRNPPWLQRCPRRPGWTQPGWLYPSAVGRVCAQYKPGLFARPDGGVRASAYHLVLRPRVVDDYRFYGYCLVVTFGVVSDRALDTGDPAVAAYYRRLRREAVLVREFSPFDRGASPVPFNFDLSYNYYPLAYNRPGPVARVYRLRRCHQAYGAPIVKVPRARELPPFAPRHREPGTSQDET